MSPDTELAIKQEMLSKPWLTVNVECKEGPTLMILAVEVVGVGHHYYP